MADLQDVINRLEAINEDLSDLAIDRLRASLESSESAAADEEKRITRARRAVEKAMGLLAGLPDSDD